MEGGGNGHEDSMKGGGLCGIMKIHGEGGGGGGFVSYLV